MALPEVLVVDDDVAAIQLIQKILTGEARVRFARSGEDGLEQARRALPDLILLDIDMPGMGGLAACRALKADARTADVPVLFITRFGDETSERAALDAGASDFMSKPLTEVKVLARLRSHWRTRRQMQHVLHLMPDLPLLPQTVTAPRLLIVDDDAQARDAVGVALAGTGAQLEFVASGAEALDRVLTQRPDLLMLDLMMPGLNGFQVLATLKATGDLDHLPVIAITRLRDEDSEAEALASGATDFIAKPFSPAVLQARVRNVLRLKLRADAAVALEREHWRQLGDARVAQLVAAAPQAILAVDGRGRVRLANNAARALWPAAPPGVLAGEGVSGQALVGRSVAELWPVLAPVLALPAGTARLAPPAEADAAPVEVSWSHQGEGVERLTTLFVHDLRDQLRADAAQRAQERLAAERQTRAEMLGFVAHELGNPLNGIVGLTRLTLMPGAHALDAKLQQRLGLVQQCAQQAVALMRDLLDLHRMESGHFALELSEVSVGAAAAQALGAVAAQAELADIRLNCDEAPADLWLQADPHRLQQVLVNLLSNAVKYNRAGGAVWLLAHAHAQQGMVELEVRDNGLGMTEAQVAHLFEPGNRLGREGGAAPGSGLGLVLARMLCEAMGGRLAVRSTPRQGSSFSVWLPAAPTQAQHAE